jgi:ubiquinone/menaquinone biosynthesis C-methylase UbiE
MESIAPRKLADTQLQTFADNDYVTDELFGGMAAAIEHDFPSGEFSFLDVGGGRGLFADRLLSRFACASGTVLDNSELLLSMNTANDRKTAVLGSAFQIAEQFAARAFDIVFFNLSLHHFVADTYSATRRLQRHALSQAAQVLSSRGRVAVTENLFEGIVAHNFPGFLVYEVTSSKMLAPMVKRIGANTAGCGVCFLSARAWRGEFQHMQLRELRFVPQVWHESELSRRVCLRLLGVRSVSRAFFWLAPQSGDTSLRMSSTSVVPSRAQ